MLAQAIAIYCMVGAAPNCAQLVVPFPGVATQTACEHAINIAEPSFLHDNPRYIRLKDSPIECEGVSGDGGGEA